jgi:predicted  nucleic acid-binding Zn-ribbon protein
LRAETIQSSKERLVKKSKEIEVKRTELHKILEKTEKEEEKLRKKSDKARKIIEARILKSYDKIRTSYRNGLVVVPISRSSCGGCFNHIPPQMQLEVSLHKKIIACEHCGRILVDDSIANPQANATEE